MKITDEQLQKIIHEELQEAVRKGEMTEQELKQIEEASIKNWFKDVGKAIGTAGSVGMRKYKKERAKTAEKEKAAKAAGGVDPDRLTPQLTKQILNTPDTKPTPASTAPKSVSDVPPATAPVGNVQQLQRPIQDFQMAFKRFSDAVKNDKNIDVTSMIGNVLVKLPNGELSLVPASDKLAYVTFNKARDEQALANVKGAIPPEAAKLGAGNPKQPEVTQSAVSPTISNSQYYTSPTTVVGGKIMRESKNPSYQETYNKWQKLIKG